MINCTKLDSGITVASDYSDAVESVSISINVKTGSRNETIENNGISHFLEHMAFKGTTNRNAKQIAYDFENIGASFNAYTSREITSYYGKVLKEYFENIFEILTDMMQNSIFSEEELERERGVILQEFAMVNDTPDDIIEDYFQSVAFKDQPYGRSIIGTEENIKKFSKKDFLNYIDNNYVADNIFIISSGNLKHKELLKCVEKYFTKVNTNKRKNIEKASYTSGYFFKQKKLEQAHCILGFEGLSYIDKDYYKFNILNHIIGGSMSSRLFQKIREELGLCYTIGSQNQSTFETGDFEIYFATYPEKMNEAVKSVLNELNIVLDKGILDEELTRAKIKIKSSILMQIENVNARASILSSGLMLKNKITDIKAVSQEIENTTKDEILHILERIIKSKPTIAIYGDVKKPYDYDMLMKLCK